MMRQPLIIQGAQSPLAQTFAQFAQAMASGPTAEERAYKQAISRKAMAEAEKEATQQQAMSGVGGKLAKLFGQFTSQGDPVVPWTNPDTGEVVQNTMPSVPLATPEQANTLRSTGLAELYASVGKDNAQAIQDGLATGEAYGNPDNMRRSMVLQGKAINQDFSPTVEEGNRVASRNSSLAQGRDLAKINATPLTESQVKGRRLDENWNNLQDLPIEQKKALGALPTKAFSVTTPDGTTVSMGGSDTGDTTHLTKPNTDRQQAALQVNQEARDLVSTIQKDLETNPNAVGPVGNVLRGAQNGADIYQSLVRQFGSPEAFEKQAKAAEEFARSNGITLEFNENLPRVVRANNLLIMKAAAAIANQSGRSLSDKDVVFVKNIVGDPASWTEGPSAYGAGLKQLAEILDKNIQTSSDMLKSGQVQFGPTGGAPATAAPAAPAVDPNIEAARKAIAAGKSREHVLQRLRQNGITPPPDL